MIQIVKMSSGNDLDMKMCDGKDLEKLVMCGGNDLDSANDGNDLDNENVWW